MTRIGPMVLFSMLVLNCVSERATPSEDGGKLSPDQGFAADVAVDQPGAIDPGSSGFQTWPPRDSELLFAEDPVGRKLRSVSRPPPTVGELERMLGIGRACSGNHRGIYIIEEAQSRPGGIPTATHSALPRVVMTACPQDEELRPWEIFAVLVSDDTRELQDPLDVEVFEMMGWNSLTASYEFYRASFGSEGLIRWERFVEVHPKEVTSYIWNAGGQVHTQSPIRHCAECHNHFEPLMVELRQPWARWKSSEQLDVSGSYLGDTAEYVSLSSRANALEPVIIEGLQRVIGNSRSPARLSRLLEENVEEILEVILCTSTFHARSAGPSFPLEVLVDPIGLPDGISVHIPSRFHPETLVPVRGEFDRILERRLQQQGFLGRDTIEAVRLYDDENPAFSAKRCALLEPVLALLKEQEELDNAIRITLEAALASNDSSSLASQLARAILSNDSQEISVLRADYAEDVRHRIEGLRHQTKEEIVLRVQEAARAWAGEISPLPVLVVEPR